MPELKLLVDGKTRCFTPTKANTIEINLSDGQKIIIAVENTGINNQVEDFMYKARYVNPNGITEPNGHTYGSLIQLETGLSRILNILSQKHITIIKK